MENSVPDLVDEEEKQEMTPRERCHLADTILCIIAPAIAPAATEECIRREIYQMQTHVQDERQACWSDGANLRIVHH